MRASNLDEFLHRHLDLLLGPLAANHLNRCPGISETRDQTAFAPAGVRVLLKDSSREQRLLDFRHGQVFVLSFLVAVVGEVILGSTCAFSNPFQLEHCPSSGCQVTGLTCLISHRIRLPAFSSAFAISLGLKTGSLDINLRVETDSHLKALNHVAWRCNNGVLG
jgi:hypothetical protein